MANYKKLTDVEVMEEVSENTMALVEENGKLKKVPCGAGFGGGNGVATAIIRGDIYMNMLSQTAPLDGMDFEDYTCDNMTFKEAKDIILAGEPLDVIMMYNNPWGDNAIVHPQIYVDGLKYGRECIELFVDRIYNSSMDDYYSTRIFWTATGFSHNDPNAVA